MSSDVAALFVRSIGSPYAAFPGVSLFDLARDALSFDLSCPVVAHPPCRGWGRLRHLSKHAQTELDLARWSLFVVRHCGGVLEHPIASRLWSAFGIRAGVRDSFGGLLVPVDQSAYGHRAQKRTGLYLVGCELVPSVDWGMAGHSVPVQSMCRAERERTPPAFASLLVSLARSSVAYVH